MFCSVACNLFRDISVGTLFKLGKELVRGEHGANAILEDLIELAYKNLRCNYLDYTVEHYVRNSDSLSVCYETVS
jgi:hypothetical protein